MTYDTGKGKGNPCHGLTKKLDFELQMGFFVSRLLAWGKTLDIDDAPDHIFGFVLVNAWSSRDIQMFEMTGDPLIQKVDFQWHL